MAKKNNKSRGDPAMDRARALFERSGLSLGELGERMGYSVAVGKRAAWQFLRKTNDPRLSMLRRFAAALGVEITTLFAE